MGLFKRYKEFIVYISVALTSFLIDILFFNIFLLVFKNNTNKIIIATILARIISSFINYLLNKNKVFHNNDKVSHSIIKYYCLVIVQMLISALLVDKLCEMITINPTFIKIPVELIIFICNYLIQKIFVFRNDKNENK